MTETNFPVETNFSVIKKEETRPGTEKRCSQNLQRNPLGSGFTKGRENFPQLLVQ